MSEATSPNPLPEESEERESPLSHVHGDEARALDEVEAFEDPFSDLSLFLSKGIKRALSSYGSPKRWSTQIQKDLIKNLLPEFKERFPTYHLGSRALKKVWEKVGFYYGKVQNEGGALTPSGEIDVDFMIKENLKAESLPQPLEGLPPYNYAQEIAVRIGECLATLQGERPDIPALTGRIWSLQRHLLPGISPQNAKTPFEEYTPLDKLIVKSCLEQSSKGALPPEELKGVIKGELQALKKITTGPELTAKISILLSNHLYDGSLSCQPTVDFIIKHLSSTPRPDGLPLDAHLLDTAQKILTLYPVAASLPKGLTDDELTYAIDTIDLKQGDEDIADNHNIDPTLFVFLSAELHRFNQDETPYETVVGEVMTAYREAEHLPTFNLDHLDTLEMLIWTTIEGCIPSSERTSAEEMALIKREIGALLIESPYRSFKALLSSTLQLLKQSQKVSHKGLSERLDYWVNQSDMFLRWIHFDGASPLLALIEQEHKSGEWDDHDAFTHHIHTLFLSLHPHLSPFGKVLEERVWILYKYHWYHTLSEGGEATIERFKKWHEVDLALAYPKGEIRERTSLLIERLLPLVPSESHAL